MGCGVVWSSCVCVSVCPLSYLKNHIFKFHEICLYMLPLAVVLSCSGGTAIRYVLRVSWMTSCFHIMERVGQNHRRCLCFVHFTTQLHRGVGSLLSSTVWSLAVCRLIYPWQLFVTSLQWNRLLKGRGQSYKDWYLMLQIYSGWRLAAVM